MDTLEKRFQGIAVTERPPEPAARSRGKMGDRRSVKQGDHLSSGVRRRAARRRVQQEKREAKVGAMRQERVRPAAVAVDNPVAAVAVDNPDNLELVMAYDGQPLVMGGEMGDADNRFGPELEGEIVYGGGIKKKRRKSKKRKSKKRKSKKKKRRTKK